MHALLNKTQVLVDIGRLRHCCQFHVCLPEAKSPNLGSSSSSSSGDADQKKKQQNKARGQAKQAAGKAAAAKSKAMKQELATAKTELNKKTKELNAKDKELTVMRKKFKRFRKGKPEHSLAIAFGKAWDSKAGQAELDGIVEAYTKQEHPDVFEKWGTTMEESAETKATDATETLNYGQVCLRHHWDLFDHGNNYKMDTFVALNYYDRNKLPRKELAKVEGQELLVPGEGHRAHNRQAAQCSPLHLQ